MSGERGNHHISRGVNVRYDSLEMFIDGEFAARFFRGQTRSLQI